MRADVLQGDALTVLRTLAARSVQTAVTSPPYWGLRSYLDAEHADKPLELGSEQTPAEYVARLVAVFAEVRRVLKDDGTLWLNLGSSYSSGGNGLGTPECKQRTNKGSHLPRKSAPAGFKPKDLVPIPWMAAMALQADGWYLRADIIWHKPNPMPSSVTDRPTPAHEYIFLLSKQARYYYDAAAIAEPVAESSMARWAQDVDGQTGSERANAGGKTNGNMKAVGGPRASRDNFRRENSKRGIPQGQQTMGTHRPDRRDSEYDLSTRNKRSVWTIPTHGYKAAHFATFPPKLIAPCILAGCPEGGTVLDPFAGAGTTLLVANGLCRHGLGIELSETYCGMIRERLAQGHLDWTGEGGE